MGLTPSPARLDLKGAKRDAQDLVAEMKDHSSSLAVATRLRPDPALGKCHACQFGGWARLATESRDLPPQTCLIRLTVNLVFDLRIGHASQGATRSVGSQ